MISLSPEASLSLPFCLRAKYSSDARWNNSVSCRRAIDRSRPVPRNSRCRERSALSQRTALPSAGIKPRRPHTSMMLLSFRVVRALAVDPPSIVSHDLPMFVSRFVYPAYTRYPCSGLRAVHSYGVRARGAESDYDRDGWEGLGNQGWGCPRLSPLYQESKHGLTT